MASPPIDSSRPAHASSSFAKLPEELLSEILQRLPVPAKELCRLRTVCRTWRSLTSDPGFITAHADRHREPLFVAKFWGDDRHVHVLDLSGNVVKRIAGADGGHHVLRTRLNQLACLATEWNTFRLLNPATGGIRVLPLTPTLHYEDGYYHLRNADISFALGLVASTGDYKLLRCWRPVSNFGLIDCQQLTGLHVLTINGGGDWRPRAVPHPLIDVCSGAVVDAVVYFLTLPVLHQGPQVPADHILSFDLDREVWRRDLHGPSSTGNVIPGQMIRSDLTLADLKGSLVLAHHPHRLSIMDIWFLQDFESGLWVKEYHIQTEPIASSLADSCNIIPLLALHDGRLVIYLDAPIGQLFICDQGTNTFTRVDMGHRLDSVGAYTGSLLSLQQGDLV